MRRANQCLFAALTALACRATPKMSAAVVNTCVDLEDETDALACSGDLARRVGDTLFVRLDSGRESIFVTVNGEAEHGVTYSGRVGRAGFHLLRSWGGEVPPRYLVMSSVSGQFASFAEVPVLSPDSTRVAAGTEAWGDCDLAGGASFKIARVSESAPVEEMALDPWKCGDKAGWAATELYWRSQDTLAFIRRDIDSTAIASKTSLDRSAARRPMLAVRTGNRWTLVQARSQTCTDSIEARALACADGAARRSRDTLFIRLSSSRETTFVNAGGEDDEAFRYEGRLLRGAYHMLRVSGGEVWPRWLFVNAVTGRSVLTPGMPKFSPDSQYFATGSPMWETCGEASVVELNIWRVTDTLPINELHRVTWDCSNKPGWAATDLRWTPYDILAFVQRDVHVSGKQRPMFAIRSANGWSVDQPH